MDHPMQFAEVNGTRLAYQTAGEGVPVVFVHGLCLDMRMWDDQFDVFAEHYRVIRCDVRGFGKSALPTEERYRPADDLHALLEHLGVVKAHVIGLSMGGRIVLHYGLLYPESTLSLVLVDSALDGYEWTEDWDNSLDAIAERGGVSGARAANEMWLEHELFAPARERAECRTKLETIVRDDSGWTWVNNNPVKGIHPRGGDRLADVRVPTLVVVGDRDLLDFQRIADKLAAEIPAAKKIVLEGAGHMSNMERPAEFNAAVLEFLATL
jgi:pimeloyl-ACP methyl ester carboxylesterase